MNFDTESAECIHGMCGNCHYEDCACECHAPDDEPFYDPDENTTFEESGYA